jgi:hypothetical protein
VNDIAIDLARNGRGRVLTAALYCELANEHPGASIELIRQRYFRVLFSSPMWGVIFGEETNHADPNDN